MKYTSKESNDINKDEFIWSPSHGCDQNSLSRLKSRFGKPPAQPMGEAWFMGNERRMFDHLYSSPDCLPLESIAEAFEEIISGLTAFGHYKEWHDWYHYLLVICLERMNRHQICSLLEYCVSGYFICYSNDTENLPYKEFKEDALNTLGKMMMNSKNWSDSSIIFESILHEPANSPSDFWGWWDASSDLCCSLFFCLKYLPDELVHSWFQSVLDIPSPHWRAQIIVWLVGAHPLISGDIKKISKLTHQPDISWEQSYLLSTDISTKNRRAIATCVNQYFTEDKYIEWLEIISIHDYLIAETTEILTMFEKIFIDKKIEI